MPKKKTATPAVKLERALQVLAVTGSRTAAAKAAGVRTEQVSRWLRDEGNRKRVLELVNEGMEPARIAWQALVIASIERLVKLVQSKDETIAERSARTVLDRHREFAPHVHQHDHSALSNTQLIAKLEESLAKLKANAETPK